MEVPVPNFAGVLKGEIRRLARKEVKATVMPLRKLVTTLRRRVAEQRKLVSELERAAKRAGGGTRAATVAESEPQVRFSAQWVKSHRKKLGMSRRVYAKLVGVSAQSIFGWETGRTRPRRTALESWRRIRTMGKREVKALAGAVKMGRRGRAASDRPGRLAVGRRRAAKKK